MELKPGYKLTEVGVIPEHWAVLPFENLARIERGKFTARPRNDPKYYGGDIPFIQTGDVTNANGKITTYSQTLNEQGLKVSKLFPRGTLFFTIAANIGDVGFAEFDTACPDSLVAITPNQGTDKIWLAYELAKRKDAFESIATYNAQLNINLEKLRPYLLPLPPLPEQRAIATALSDMDELLGALDRLIAKKRDLKQAAMQQLLTGKTRLPGFDGEWITKQIGTEIDLLTGYPFPSAQYSSSGIRLLRGSNIKRGVTDWSDDLVQYWLELTSDIKQYLLSEGDIVVAMDGSLVGRSFARLSKADLPALLLQRVARIRSEKIDMGYLKEWICSQFFTEHCDAVKTVTAIPHISPGDIKSFIVQIPPTKKEQRAIATVLSDMDAEITALEQRRDKTRALKQAMMQELLTGRTRLV